LECLNIEQPVTPDYLTLLQRAHSLETQMALLALSEKFLGLSEINQILINGMTADKETWMSNIGLNALVTACKSHVITVHSVTSSDYLNIYKTETIAEKMAHCLNIYEDVFELVSFKNKYYFSMNPKKYMHSYIYSISQ